MEGHFSALKQAPLFGLIKLILDREWLDRQEIRHISAIANNSIRPARLSMASSARRRAALKSISILAHRRLEGAFRRHSWDR